MKSKDSDLIKKMEKDLIKLKETGKQYDQLRDAYNKLDKESRKAQKEAHDLKKENSNIKQEAKNQADKCN